MRLPVPPRLRLRDLLAGVTMLCLGFMVWEPQFVQHEADGLCAWCGAAGHYQILRIGPWKFKTVRNLHSTPLSEFLRRRWSVSCDRHDVGRSWPGVEAGFGAGFADGGIFDELARSRPEDTRALIALLLDRDDPSHLATCARTIEKLGWLAPPPITPKADLSVWFFDTRRWDSQLHDSTPWSVLRMRQERRLVSAPALHR